MSKLLVRLTAALLLATTMNIAVSGQAHSQVFDPDTGACISGCGGPDIPDPSDPPAADSDIFTCSDCGAVDPEETIDLVPISATVTEVLVEALGDTDRSCSNIYFADKTAAGDQDVFQIDCISMHYRQIAKSIPDNSDYKGVKAALTDAADKLEKIVVENQDPEVRAAEIRERGKPDAPVAGTVRAIKPEKLAAATRAAERVIAETATMILRSGEIPTRRNVHYTKIAESVSGNLVILRA